MDDNTQNTNQLPAQPQYLGKDTSKDILNNLDINTAQLQAANPSNIEESAQQGGYSSPYIQSRNINLSEMSNQPLANTAPVAPQVLTSNSVTAQGSQTPSYQPHQEIETKHEPREKVIYEKTIVEKQPSLFSKILGQIFRSLGCLLFSLFVLIAVIVYLINF